MGLLSDLINKDIKTISIVGMAKNAGKTTALNYLIEEAYDEGLKPGITSTGRDGETVDLVTETEKPKVFLYEDTLVSVPEQLFPLAEAGLEVLDTTAYRTSLGKLYLCKVRERGNVQIAGPVSSKDMKAMAKDMLGRGVDLVLIDGAIDRKSVSAPEYSDGVILSTGAVLSRDMKKVVNDTLHLIELYSLPETEEGELRSLLEKDNSPEQILIINEDLTCRSLDLKTGLTAGRYISEAIEKDTKYVFIPGAFTVSILDDMDPMNIRNVEFILKNPTRIFLDSVQWKKMKKKGLKIQVLKNINLCALTVNPVSPKGYTLDRQQLLEEFRRALPNLPVIDVKDPAGSPAG